MKAALIAALLVTAFVSSALAEDEEGCVQIAKDYISKHGSDDERSKFESHWKGMVQTAASDVNQEDEEHFINRYIFDWMADRRGRFQAGTLTIKDKLEACRIYLIFKNLNGDGSERQKGRERYHIPSKVAEYLTVENIKKYVADEPKAVKKTVSAEKEQGK